MIIVSLVNVLGYLDAIIRFPRVPVFDSFFALKLVLCVIAKTVAYSMGFIDVQKWTLTFLTALFMNVWLLPVLYVLVIPYGDSSPFRKDRDILVSVFYVLIDRSERAKALESLFSLFPSFIHTRNRKPFIRSKDMSWI